jgi:16S rRNA (adenine1518-N6/adenine1519-N6)-dimethyltransferase
VIRARRRFGQHFLHDPAVIARIVAAIALRPGDAAVEIGPGRGALTARLLAAAGQLDAIEIDRDLAAALRERFAAEPRWVLHESDALRMDWRALAAERGARLRVIGNLPYNISTPLLFRLLEASEAILDMHFMLQKEVVDRIVASPRQRRLWSPDRDARAARAGHPPARGRSRRIPPGAAGEFEPWCV